MKIEITHEELLNYIKEKYGLDKLQCEKIQIEFGLYYKFKEWREDSGPGPLDKGTWRYMSIEPDNGDFASVKFFVKGEKHGNKN